MSCQSRRGFNRLTAEVSVNQTFLKKFQQPCANKSGYCIKCHKLYRMMTDKNGKGEKLKTFLD